MFVQSRIFKYLNLNKALGGAKSDWPFKNIVDTPGESFAYPVTRKSFQYVGKLSFLHTFLVVAKTATAVVRLKATYRKLSWISGNLIAPPFLFEMGIFFKPSWVFCGIV